MPTMTTSPDDTSPDYPIDPVDPDAPDLDVIPDANGQSHVPSGVTL